MKFYSNEFPELVLESCYTKVKYILSVYICLISKSFIKSISWDPENFHGYNRKSIQYPGSWVLKLLLTASHIDSTRDWLNKLLVCIFAYVLWDRHRFLQLHFIRKLQFIEAFKKTNAAKWFDQVSVNVHLTSEFMSVARKPT